jgi:bacteriocin-like protein
MDKDTLRELNETELDHVSGGVPNEPPYNGNQGGGPGNSGNGDKNGSDVVGPPS